MVVVGPGLVVVQLARPRNRFVDGFGGAVPVVVQAVVESAVEAAVEAAPAAAPESQYQLVVPPLWYHCSEWRTVRATK